MSFEEKAAGEDLRLGCSSVSGALCVRHYLSAQCDTEDLRPPTDCCGASWTLWLHRGSREIITPPELRTALTESLCVMEAFPASVKE